MRISVPGLPAFDSNNEVAGATFARMTISDVANNNIAVSQVGGCMVFRRTGTQDEIISGVGTTTLLDAGSSLTLNGPNANNIALSRDASNTYNRTLYSSGFGGFGGEGSPTIGAGTYTVAGTGGSQVGAFNASLTVPGNFSWTNQANITDPISRSSNLVINWTGGGDGLVAITGVAGTRAGGTTDNPVSDSGVFSCTAPASAGTFSVPTAVLQQLPAVPAASETGVGMLMVMAMPDPAKNQGTFTAPLVGGGSIDWGFFSYQIGSTKTTGWN
jgi:hypothetical protein